MRSRLETITKECFVLKQEKEQLQKDMIKKCTEHVQSGERDGATSVCSCGSHKSGGSDMETAPIDSIAEMKDKKLLADEDDDFLNKLLAKKEKDRSSISSGYSGKSDKKIICASNIEFLDDEKVKTLKKCIVENEKRLQKEIEYV